jgi:integrase
VDKGFCATSPLAKIKPVTIDRDEPQILTLEETRKVLAAAASHKKGVCLPFIAIGLFAGVRPKEIARLTWADVNLDAKTITISGKAAKLRERRIVELSENAVAWLEPFALARPAFVGVNFRRDLDAVKILAGFGGRKKQRAKGAPGTGALRPWTADVLRHTAISYHLAKWQHEGKTALWAGNSPDIIQRHYRGLVSQDDAKSFWKIAPDAISPIKRQKKTKTNACTADYASR